MRPLRSHLGTLIAVLGVAALGLALSFLRGPSQGIAMVGGSILIGAGLWIQCRMEIDLSSPSPAVDERLMDYLPGKIGGDPRPWLEAHRTSDIGHSDMPDHD
jgi:hypothetical protein